MTEWQYIPPEVKPSPPSEEEVLAAYRRIIDNIDILMAEMQSFHQDVKKILVEGNDSVPQDAD